MLKELTTVPLQLNDGQDIRIDGWVWYDIDLNYGADADGNRGEKRVYVSRVTDLTGYKDNGEILALPPESQEQAEELLIRKFLES